MWHLITITVENTERKWLLERKRRVKCCSHCMFCAELCDNSRIKKMET
jgi:hypothetical protein